MNYKDIKKLKKLDIAHEFAKQNFSKFMAFISLNVDEIKENSDDISMFGDVAKIMFYRKENNKTIKIHKLLQYRKVTCLGDMWHNERIKTLFDGVNIHYKYAKEMVEVLNKTLNKYEEHTRWIIDILHWEWCKRINFIMKSQSKVTFVNRLNLFLHDILLVSSHKYLMNKELANNIDNLISKYETK